MYGNLDFYSKVTVPYSQIVTNINAQIGEISEAAAFNAKQLYSAPKATLSAWYDNTAIFVRKGYSQLSENTSSMYDASIAQVNNWMKDVSVAFDQIASSSVSFANRLYANPQTELSKLYDTFTAGGNAYLQEMNSAIEAFPGQVSSVWSNTRALFSESTNWSTNLLMETGESMRLFVTGFYLEPQISWNVLKFNLTEFGIDVLSSALKMTLKVL